MGDGLLDELVGAVDVGQRLLQVDDVDAVALGEDEALHLRVPAPGLVPEVDAALEQLLHGDDRLVAVPASACPASRRGPRAGGRRLLGCRGRPGGRPRPDPRERARRRRHARVGRTESAPPPRRSGGGCGRAKSTRRERVAAESVRRGAGPDRNPRPPSQRPAPSTGGRPQPCRRRPPRSGPARRQARAMDLRGRRRALPWLLGAAGLCSAPGRPARGRRRPRPQPAGGWPLDRPAARWSRAFDAARRAVRARAPRRRPARPGRRPGARGRRRAWWPSPGRVAGRGVVVGRPPGRRCARRTSRSRPRWPAATGSAPARSSAGSTAAGEPLPAGGLPALGPAARRRLPRPAARCSARSGSGCCRSGLRPATARARPPRRRAVAAGSRRGGPTSRRPAPARPWRLAAGVAAGRRSRPRRCWSGWRRLASAAASAAQSRAGRSAASRA